MNPTIHAGAPRSRRRRFMTAGVVAAGLSLAGAGAAMAGDESPETAGTTPEAAESTMPDGYTQEQYDAFWGAGYSYDDVLELNELWSSSDTETKARAGQLLLDGQSVPVAPTGPDEAPAPAEDAPPTEAAPPAEGTAPAAEPASDGGEYTQEQYDAFWGAGYTIEDVEALNALWQSDFTETKSRAGQMILDGQTPPVAPGSTPAAS